MEEKLSIMNSRFNKRVLIDMFVWNDDRDSSRHIIYVRKKIAGKYLCARIVTDSYLHRKLISFP